MANQMAMQPDGGYVDLQVNGFAGADFNGDDLSAESLHRACQCLRDDGAAGFLATVITGDLEAMARRLSRLVELRQADPLATELIWGFHIEGPFISPESGFVGAHPPQHVRRANLDELKPLLEATDGLTKIVTLAPEHDEGMQLTRYLADQGIVVSAGHCNPSLEQLQAAVDAGLTMFTHLGNGCAARIERHDNVIQRVLSQSEKLWISFIADGIHVPFFALKSYVRAAGLERCVVVSDAISAAGLGPGHYAIGDKKVHVGEDRATRDEGGKYLVGSATSVSQMANDLQQHLELADAEIEQLTSLGPRSILRRL